MRKLIKPLVFGLFLTAFAWIGFMAWRAGRDRVTLDVQNASLAEVVRTVQTQTWEYIWVTGRSDQVLTLNIRDLPLSEAMELIAKEAGLEVNVIWPIYKQRASLNALEDKVFDPARNKLWANYNPHNESSPFRRPTLPSGTHLVNLKIENKPAWEVASELSRFSNADVIVEDSAHENVSLSFTETEFTAAVEQFAEALDRKFAKIYVLKPAQ